MRVVPAHGRGGRDLGGGPPPATGCGRGPAHQAAQLNRPSRRPRRNPEIRRGRRLLPGPLSHQCGRSTIGTQAGPSPQSVRCSDRRSGLGAGGSGGRKTFHGGEKLGGARPAGRAPGWSRRGGRMAAAVQPHLHARRPGRRAGDVPGAAGGRGAVVHLLPGCAGRGRRLACGRGGLRERPGSRLLSDARGHGGRHSCAPHVDAGLPGSGRPSPRTAAGGVGPSTRAGGPHRVRALARARHLGRPARPGPRRRASPGAARLRADAGSRGAAPVRRDGRTARPPRADP